MTHTRVDRRALLVEAAVELFSSRSFDEVSVGDITGRAGVAYGLVAHYFGSKRGLYLAAMQNIADQVRNVRGRLLPAGGAAAQVRAGIGRHIAWVQDHAALFEAVMRGGIGADPDAWRLIGDLRGEAAEELLRALGVSAPVQPLLRTAVHGWQGFLDEAVLDRLRHRDRLGDDLVALVTRLLAAALRSAADLDDTIRLDPEVLVALASAGP
jgi:AcrR family transcriptional regulator